MREFFGYFNMENRGFYNALKQQQTSELRLNASTCSRGDFQDENDGATVVVHAMPVLEELEQGKLNTHSRKKLTYFVNHSGEFSRRTCDEPYTDLTGIPRVICCCCKDGKRVVVDRATQVDEGVNTQSQTLNGSTHNSILDPEMTETVAHEGNHESVENKVSQGANACLTDSEGTRRSVDLISELVCNNLDKEEELDTQEIATCVLDDLRKYNIPQSIFARRVLKRSQGTLSDNLRRPKPWKELRAGREIFMKMKLWLGIPEVQRIPDLRRAVSAKDEIKEEPKPPTQHSIPIQLLEYADFRPPKKPRHFFTETQKRSLFAIFRETPKPSREMQEALAEQLGIDKKYC